MLILHTSQSVLYTLCSNSSHWQHHVYSSNFNIYNGLTNPIFPPPALIFISVSFFFIGCDQPSNYHMQSYNHNHSTRLRIIIANIVVHHMRFPYENSSILSNSSAGGGGRLKLWNSWKNSIVQKNELHS